MRAFQSIFADFAQRHEGKDAVKHISEAGRIIVRLDCDPQTVHDEPMEPKRNEENSIVRQRLCKKHSLTVQYLEEGYDIDEERKKDEERSRKRRRILQETSRSPIPSSSAPSSLPISDHTFAHATSPKETNEILNPADASIHLGDATSSITAQQKEAESPDKDVLSVAWTLACRNAALSVPKSMNPIRGMDIRSIEAEEEVEEVKGIYNLLD